MSRIWDIVMYSILAAMAVLVLTHGKEAIGLLSTGGKIWLGETSILTGSGYKPPSL